MQKYFEGHKNYSRQFFKRRKPHYKKEIFKKQF